MKARFVFEGLKFIDLGTISMEDAIRQEREEFADKPMEDLDVYTYGYHGYGKKPNKNVLAVGWLDSDRPFNKGPVPEGFVQKLRGLKRMNQTKGSHECPFCGKAHGSAEVEVKDGKIFYRAPELIAHYVKSHNYQPPQAFIDAVMKPKSV